MSLNEAEKEILETLKELAIKQAVLHEKIESHMKKLEKLESLEKTVNTHNIFMKVSIAVVSALFSAFGIKLFGSGGIN